MIRLSGGLGCLPTFPGCHRFPRRHTSSSKNCFCVQAKRGTVWSELRAYTLLAAAVQSSAQVAAELLSLHSADAHAPAVRHALQCIAAHRAGNWVQLADLEAIAPGVGGAFVAALRTQQRRHVLCVARAAFKPRVPAWELCDWLGVDVGDAAALAVVQEQGLRLVNSSGEAVSHLGAGVFLDCKAPLARR